MIMPVGPVGGLVTPVSPLAGRRWRSPLRKRTLSSARRKAGMEAPPIMRTRKMLAPRQRPADASPSAAPSTMAIPRAATVSSMVAGR